MRNSLSRVVTINGTPWHGRREFLGGRAFFVGAWSVGVTGFDSVVEFIEVVQFATRLGSKPHNPHNRYIHHNRFNGESKW